MGKDMEGRLLRRLVIRAKEFEAMSVKSQEDRDTLAGSDGMMKGRLSYGRPETSR